MAGGDAGNICGGPDDCGLLDWSEDGESYRGPDHGLLYAGVLANAAGFQPAFQYGTDLGTGRGAQPVAVPFLCSIAFAYALHPVCAGPAESFPADADGRERVAGGNRTFPSLHRSGGGGKGSEKAGLRETLFHIQ